MSLFVFQSVPMASFVKRPCSEETEDDILREQEEFLKTRSTPSARPVRVTRPREKRKSKSTDSRGISDSDSSNIQGRFCELCVSLNDWPQI